MSLFGTRWKKEMRPIVYIPDSVSNPWKYKPIITGRTEALDFWLPKKQLYSKRALCQNMRFFLLRQTIVGSWLPQPHGYASWGRSSHRNQPGMRSLGSEVALDVQIQDISPENVLPSRSKWQKWWTWIPSFAIRFSGDVPYFRRQSSGGTRRTWFSLWVSLRLTNKTVTYLPLTTTEQHLRSTGNGSQIPAWKACGTFGRNALAMVRWLSRHNVPFCHSVLDHWSN